MKLGLFLAMALLLILSGCAGPKPSPNDAPATSDVSSLDSAWRPGETIEFVDCQGLGLDAFVPAEKARAYVPPRFSVRGNASAIVIAMIETCGSFVHSNQSFPQPVSMFYAWLDINHEAPEGPDRQAYLLEMSFSWGPFNDPLRASLVLGDTIEVKTTGGTGIESWTANGGREEYTIDVVSPNPFDRVEGNPLATRFWGGQDEQFRMVLETSPGQHERLPTSCMFAPTSGPLSDLLDAEQACIASHMTEDVSMLLESTP